MTEPCSDQRLLELLESDDDRDELRGVVLHLEQCDRCRSRLEELAGDPTRWKFIRDCLTSNDRANRTELSDKWETLPSRQPSLAWGESMAKWAESTAKQLLAAPSHPEMLGRIGRYEVERIIGSGGMGVVFKAFDTELNRPVAIKVLAPYLLASVAARLRFAREARAAAAIVHEHVVAIHNVETNGDALYLVMQFVAGESLQQRLDRAGPLELREILRLGMQIAAGLASAHGQGLVHRDVKPSNILLEQGVERSLLTDFGLARATDDASLTHTGCHPGTPQYMSPEQARGDTVDSRSDLFSLGSVMYAMCTGRPPFRADSSFAILRKITDEAPRPIRDLNPEIPIWLENLVKKMLAKKADDRFQSAEQVAVLLRQCLAHVQQPQQVDLPVECRFNIWTRMRGPARRHGRKAMLAIGVAIAAVSLYAFMMSTDESPREEKSAAAQPTFAPPTTVRRLDWSESAKQFDAVDRDLTAAEQRIEQLWDVESRPQSR